MATKLVGTGVTIVPGSVVQNQGDCSRRRREDGDDNGDDDGDDGDDAALRQQFTRRLIGDVTTEQIFPDLEEMLKQRGQRGRRRLYGGTPPGPGGGGGCGGTPVPTQSSLYTGGSVLFGDDDMDEGVVLTTGNVHEPICKKSTSSKTSYSWMKSGKVDSDLVAECKKTGTDPRCDYKDTVSLEFKFTIAVGTTMNIKYVFASEEYPEFVKKLFADAFAFFVDGENIALTPDKAAVSIGTINCYDDGTHKYPGTKVQHSCRNCNLYKDNWGTADGQDQCSGWSAAKRSKGFYGFMFDGFTTVLTGEKILTPGEHTIKLVAADANDAEWDTAVFIAAKSMTAVIPMCYTVVSKKCGEVPEQYVSPVTTFPSNHPVMTRSNCDGVPGSNNIPGEGKELDGATCGKQPGGSMLYAYDGAQSRSGFAKKGQAVAYVARDGWARVYLVIELGQSLKATGYASMDIKLERVTGNPGILVADDPTDTLTWDAAKMSGRMKWKWSDKEGDGVVIGPFVEGQGWCLEWTLFEMGSGVLDKFIFGSMENGVFTEKVVMTSDVLENGVRLCGCSGTQNVQTGATQCQACDKRDNGKTCGGIASAGGTTGGGGGTSGGGGAPGVAGLAASRRCARCN